jgi:hypothetical protein
MTTKKQIAANRRNARKSTGPRTAEGRKHSKGNALKHGLTAAQITVFDERPEDFENFYSGLLAALIPIGALEEQLVERIAVCAWRLRRVYRIEAWLIGNPSSDAIEASKALTPEPALNYDLSKLTIEQLASLNALSETINDPRAGAAFVEAQTATSVEAQAATPAEAQAAISAEAQAATPAERQAATPAEPQAATSAEVQAATSAEVQAATPAEARAATSAEESRGKGASSIEAPPAYRRPTSIGNVFMGLATSHGPFIQLSRHETTIERSYHRALHDLERLQARRKGEAVMAPAALDVSINE